MTRGQYRRGLGVDRLTLFDLDRSTFGPKRARSLTSPSARADAVFRPSDRFGHSRFGYGARAPEMALARTIIVFDSNYKHSTRTVMRIGSSFGLDSRAGKYVYYRLHVLPPRRNTNEYLISLSYSKKLRAEMRSQGIMMYKSNGRREIFVVPPICDEKRTAEPAYSYIGYTRVEASLYFFTTLPLLNNRQNSLLPLFLL